MLLEANALPPVKGLDTKQVPLPSHLYPLPSVARAVSNAKSPQDSYLVDGVVGAQGPNYILAKRLQVGTSRYHP